MYVVHSVSLSADDGYTGFPDSRFLTSTSTSLPLLSIPPTSKTKIEKNPLQCIFIVPPLTLIPALSLASRTFHTFIHIKKGDFPVFGQ